MPNGNSVWTSSLLYVLTGLGIEEQTARQAIARGAAAGWITAHRQGREVQWELTAGGRRLIEQGAERVYSMSGEAPSLGRQLADRAGQHPAAAARRAQEAVRRR